MPQENGSTPPQRWFRLNAEWNETEWLYDLEPDARLAWVLLLGHVKLRGTRGSVKAPLLRMAAYSWRIPERAVQEMISAAIENEAVSVDGECWVIESWDRYQPHDVTSAERSKKWRASRGDTP